MPILIPNLVEINENVRFFKIFRLPKFIDKKPKFPKQIISITLYRRIYLKFTKSMPDVEYRDGYYFFLNNKWYYDRPILFGIGPKFILHQKNKKVYEVTYNLFYILVSFQMGNIYSLKQNILNFLQYELFLKGYLSLTASCIGDSTGANIFLAPSYNGKSTQLIYELRKNNTFMIGDDLVFVDKEIKYLYPYIELPKMELNRKDIGKKTIRNFSHNKILKRFKIKFIHIFIRSNTRKKTPMDGSSLLLTNSFHFLRNRFTMAIMAKEGNTMMVTREMNQVLKKFKNSPKINFLIKKWGKPL